MSPELAHQTVITIWDYDAVDHCRTPSKSCVLQVVGGALLASCGTLWLLSLSCISLLRSTHNPSPSVLLVERLFSVALVKMEGIWHGG